MTGNTDSLSATPSQWPNNPNRPVDKVSYNDIQIFLTRLNAQQSSNLPTGWSYVLPTESQWEYACRAGTTTAYPWGNTISPTDANWNHNNAPSQTGNVGLYNANPWGFYDMIGNVWEWTADAYQDTYPTSNPVVDPYFPVTNSTSAGVYRGGSYMDIPPLLRSASRFDNVLEKKNRNIGFRVSLQNSQ